MIMMINERNGNKTRFKNYQKLYGHIGRNQQGKRCRVMAFYEFVSAQKINAEKKSGGKPPKFDVLEISHDCSRKPVIMPITPDLDVESLLEDLCKRYCESKGYKLVEIQEDDGILHVKRAQNYPSLQLSLQW